MRNPDNAVTGLQNSSGSPCTSQQEPGGTFQGFLFCFEKGKYERVPQCVYSIKTQLKLSTSEPISIFHDLLCARAFWFLHISLRWGHWTDR